MLVLLMAKIKASIRMRVLILILDRAMAPVQRIVSLLTVIASSLMARAVLW